LKRAALLAVIIVLLTAVGFAIEWFLYELVSEKAGEVAVPVCVVLWSLSIGWFVGRERLTDGVGSGILGALSCAPTFALNYLFLQWLWIEPEGRLSVGEFGWFTPLYAQFLVWAGAAIAFGVALVTSKSRRVAPQENVS
jgi:hypothetical protein